VTDRRAVNEIETKRVSRTERRRVANKKSTRRTGRRKTRARIAGRALLDREPRVYRKMKNELSLGSTLIHAPQQVGSGHGTKTSTRKSPKKSFAENKTTTWDPTKGISGRLH
jgi:hypothetical protein